MILNSNYLGGLPSDPRTWGRDEVVQFLQYCEKEFDLEKIDLEKFAMNGGYLQLSTNLVQTHS